MKEYEFDTEVRYLLKDQNNEKVNVIYNKNAEPYLLPKIGMRPPYYAYPRYEPSYPKL